MMKLSLSVLAVAVLAACASKEPATPAPVVITPAPVVAAPPQTVVVPSTAVAPTVVAAPTPLRAGFGRIESITSLPPTAAAGGGSKPMRRISVRMDDGTVQVVDTPAQGLSSGDRIEFTSDGYLRHPA